MNSIDQVLARKSGIQDLSAPRRAPTLVTMTKSSG